MHAHDIESNVKLLGAAPGSAPHVRSTNFVGSDIDVNTAAAPAQRRPAAWQTSKHFSGVVDDSGA